MASCRTIRQASTRKDSSTPSKVKVRVRVRVRDILRDGMTRRGVRGGVKHTSTQGLAALYAHTRTQTATYLAGNHDVGRVFIITVSEQQSVQTRLLDLT